MINCQFCRKKIDEEKLMLHEMYCERNCIKCDRCGYMYDQNDPESHEEEFHQLQQCPHCKEQFQDLKKHNCQELPILCQYCKLEIPIKSFSLHEIQCGSRTEVCDSCKQYIKMSEYLIHQSICQQKKFDKLGRGEKLDDFPSIQEVQKPSKPQTYDEVIKNKQEQQKQANNKIQTSQPAEFKPGYGKIENPYDFQPKLQDNNFDQKQEFQTGLHKANKNYVNNQMQKYTSESINSKDQEKQFEDPKYSQQPKLNQGLRSTQDVYDYKQRQIQQQLNQDEKQYQQNNNIINQDNKLTQSNNQKQYSRFTIPQTQNPFDPRVKPIPNQNNDIKPLPYPTRDQQISQKNQYNQYYNNEIKNPPKYQTQERISQDKYERPLNNQEKYYNEKRIYEQTTNNYFQNQDDRLKKYPDEQEVNQQQRTQISQRNYKSTYTTQESQKQPYVSNLSNNQSIQQDNRKLSSQKSGENTQFQYVRNPKAHQQPTYSQQQPSQKLSEQQQKFQENQNNSYLDKQTKSYDQHIKKQDDYQQVQRQQNNDQIKQNSYQQRQYDYQNYQQSKLNNNRDNQTNNHKPENNPNFNDSVIAKNLSEQFLAEDLQMTQEQMQEQKELYKMMEEKAKQQKEMINSQKQNQQQATRLPNVELPNEFDFMTEEEMLIQQQLLEKFEQQKKRK
ncbi:unnamed protein product [Paramecium sonneborni]|uniref:TRAF-type domain-containing protein n=1 Tax=Paramecium sonneborni TaxID=65129 RepID=A0A8S1P812_9CILI|nr:unnamed protein product [Paramecium sonneborni]